MDAQAMDARLQELSVGRLRGRWRLARNILAHKEDLIL
jgi:hypothetical protein